MAYRCRKPNRSCPHSSWSYIALVFWFPHHELVLLVICAQISVLWSCPVEASTLLEASKCQAKSEPGIIQEKLRQQKAVSPARWKPRLVAVHGVSSTYWQPQAAPSRYWMDPDTVNVMVSVPCTLSGAIITTGIWS